MALIRPALLAARGEALRALARLIAPYAPHLAEECWAVLGHETLVAQSPWPVVDRALIVATSVTMPAM